MDYIYSPSTLYDIFWPFAIQKIISVLSLKTLEDFTDIADQKSQFADRKILVQGVIDLCLVDSNDNLILCDYKTDRLTKAELGDKSLAQKTLAEKHSLQLYYYSLAIEKIFSKQTASRRVYSLPLGDTVDV